MLHEEITASIIAAFREVYNHLPFGFWESVYGEALDLELKWRGHKVSRKVRVIVHYKGRPIKKYEMDRVVDDLIVIELKATRYLCEADHNQLIGYLTATKFEVGLLLHFGPKKPTVHRMISTNQ